MKSLGNILWLIFGGLLVAIIYYLVGLVMCIIILRAAGCEGVHSRTCTCVGFLSVLSEPCFNIRLI